MKKYDELKNVPTTNSGITIETSEKYFIKVFGCQYNEWDAIRIDFLLKKLGLTSANEFDAEIIFVVACSVRQTAIDRLLGKVRNYQKEGKKVIITGCILDDDRKKYLKKKILTWDSNKPEELKKILSNCRSNSLQNNDEKILSKNKTEKYVKKNTAAYLPIMTGCNNFCSYCVVPYTRGREKSRPFDEIVADFKKLVEKKYEKIILLGQNVNSYQFDFAKLLKTLSDISGNFEISFTSNHPKDMTDEIIFTVRDLPKVKKEIHLPLQSGSDEVLKAMNRPYTKEKYLDLVEKIKKEIPEIKLTTDVIVGFPNETEKDFQETVEIFKKINFSQAFVNKYSLRAGTAAFKLGDPISWNEKQRRWKVLNEIVNKK